ncbi:MAG: hypothetical protein MJ252_12400 [archaeon]|nr:hypothetical protein [archaeon]
MGCCAVTSINEGEDYVIKIVKNGRFLLNSFSYSELRDKIEKIAQTQKKLNAIKKNVIALLVPELEEEKPTRHDVFMNQCFTNILEDIFSNFKKSQFNVNKFMLYLFPYLYHSEQEETNRILYRILAEENNGDMNRANFEKTLEEYMSNCTSKLTFSIWECCDNDYIRRKLDEMNACFFTHSNIERIIEKLNTSLYQKLRNNNSDNITEELFLQTYTITHIYAFEEVRELFISEFDSK